MTSHVKKLRLTTFVPALSVPLLIAVACGSEAPTQPPTSFGTGGVATGSGGSLPGQGGINQGQGGVVQGQGGSGPVAQGGLAPAQGGSVIGQGGVITAQGGSAPQSGGSSAGGSQSGAQQQGGTTQNGGSSAGGSQSGGAANGGSPGAQGGSAAGGAAAMGGSGGGAPSGDLKEIAKELNGFVIVLPCQGGTGEVCQTNKTGEGCPTSTDLFKDGVSTTNATLKIGGTPGTQYTISLKLQGMVENRVYTGASAPEGDQGSALTQGFYVGGAPQTNVGDYNIYAIRVAAPKKDYFLNSLGGTALQHHRTYPVDYTATIKVEGGTSVVLLAQDTNCSAIRNCTDAPDNGQCSTTGVPGLDPLIAGKVGGGTGTSYNGQFIGMLVTNVTSP